MRPLLGFLVLILVGLTPGAVAAPDAPDEIALTSDPQKIHQVMWEQLQPRLAKMQTTAKFAALANVSNWREYDMTFYRLDLTIDHMAELVWGQVEMHGRAVADALDSIIVNLSDTLTVDSVYVETGRLTFVHQTNHVTVRLAEVLAQGEAYHFTIAYHGRPEQNSGLAGFSFSTHAGLPLISTLSEPYSAHTWWPCNDITVDKVDSADIIVTADTSLVVSSNGLQQSDIINGDGTHTVFWKERYPIAPYLISIALHPYVTWGTWYHYSPTDSMPLQFFVYRDHDTASIPHYSIIPEMITILAGRFGEYPFINEKYGCTHFNWGGAMEHQTNTSTAANDWADDATVVVHELSHQWWGDMVTCGDWHHIWINEGFATYAEAIYFEGLHGSNYYHTYMNSFEYVGTTLSIYIADTTDIWGIFDDVVYSKGGWVLHMLRHVVGDDYFFQALRDYRDQYLWSNATTEQFRDVAEAASGMDLDWFFQEWIYGVSRPNYFYSWKTEANPLGGWNTYLYIRQAQMTNPQVFTMPIDVRMVTSSGNVTQSVFDSRRTQNFTLHTVNKPTQLSLDPDRWISRQMNLESYTFHIVNDSLASGMQYAVYADTVLGKGGSGAATYTLINGTLPSGWTLQSSTGIISGTTTETGLFSFQVRAVDNAYPSMKDSVAYAVNVQVLPPRPGDANGDGDINVGDAVFIINYIFKGGDVPPILNWADVNGDCLINVGDAVALINFIFKGGAEPVLGCME